VKHKEKTSETEIPAVHSDMATALMHDGGGFVNVRAVLVASNDRWERINELSHPLEEINVLLDAAHRGPVQSSVPVVVVVVVGSRR
jgi:hypothetical protein